MERCVALYDYQARDGEELSVQKNENLTVVEGEGLWWTVRNQQGAVGLVPSNYVKALPPEKDQRPLPQSERTKLEDQPGQYHQPDLMVPSQRNGPSLNIRAVAKYRYASTREDELSLEKGDEVIVMEKEADGWWRGRCGAKIGWFPFNYVEEVGPQMDSAMESREVAAPVIPKPREKSFICGVIALYSFNSGNPEELAFQKGDLMDIIDQPADDPDWWEARKGDGCTGLVPRNYVEIVHDAEPVVSNERTTPLSQRPAQPGPANPQSSRPPPPFAHEPWYHGRVARREAESLLNSYAENGQFIVRASETKVSPHPFRLVVVSLHCPLAVVVGAPFHYIASLLDICTSHTHTHVHFHTHTHTRVRTHAHTRKHTHTHCSLLGLK